MAVTINVDTKPLSDQLARMIGRIEHFKRVDVGQGLSNFQTEEMHRHRPFTMRSRGRGAASTVIRPHSLYEMQHSGRAQSRVRRFVRSLDKPPKTERAALRRQRRMKYMMNISHRSTRPILRPELYDVLEQRMTALLNEKLKWGDY